MKLKIFISGKMFLFFLALTGPLSNSVKAKGYDGLSLGLGYNALYDGGLFEDFQGITARYIENENPGRPPLAWLNGNLSVQYGIPKLPWVIKLEMQYFKQEIPFDIDGVNCVVENCGSFNMDRQNMELSLKLQYISDLNLFNSNSMMDFYQNGEFSHIGHSFFPILGIGQNKYSPADREAAQGFPKTETGYVAGFGYGYIFPNFTLGFTGKSCFYKYSGGMQFSANFSYHFGVF